MRHYIIALLVSTLVFSACKKKEKENEQNNIQPQLVFELEFDHTLPRLDNLGDPVSIPAGNWGQHPDMKLMSAHYIELQENSLTQLGEGEILFKGIETTLGGANAVDFDQAIFSGNGEDFLKMNISEVAPGTYEWIRMSLTYQRYDVEFHYDTTIQGVGPVVGDDVLHLSSFVGFNNYITTHQVNNSLQTVNANKTQGFWMGEIDMNIGGFPVSWQDTASSAGPITVVNPNPNSPIPQGSCVVTGRFDPPLVITGNEQENLEVVLALSTNMSFEWKDDNGNKKWDAMDGEQVVDMGLRGLHPRVK